jgi:multidrug efflux pump subunit AcrA (membrane-fusion protein)
MANILLQKFITKRNLIILAAVILIVILTIFLMRDSSNAKIEEVATAKYGVITAFVEEMGIVKTQVGASVNVGTRASGTLLKLPYKVGDYVKEGDLLALIDDRDLQANLESAKATLNRLQTELEMINKTYPQQIKQTKSRIDATKSTYDYTSKNYEREKVLLKKDFTTEDSVDRAKRERDVARADYEMSKAELIRIEAEFQERKAASLASIKAQEEQIKALEIAISFTKIYAPISGYVAQVIKQEGETVVAQLNAENLISLIDPTKLEVQLLIDETDITDVKEGSIVKYYVGALPNRWFESTIKTIWPQPISTGNIVYYVAIVPVTVADAAVVRPNMTVHARIITNVKPASLIIPIEALKFVDGKTVVYKVVKEKLVETEVKTGLKNDKEVEILEGIKEGDKVAVKFEFVKD